MFLVTESVHAARLRPQLFSELLHPRFLFDLDQIVNVLNLHTELYPHLEVCDVEQLVLMPSEVWIELHVLALPKHCPCRR